MADIIIDDESNYTYAPSSSVENQNIIFSGSGGTLTISPENLPNISSQNYIYINVTVDDSAKYTINFDASDFLVSGSGITYNQWTKNTEITYMTKSHAVTFVYIPGNVFNLSDGEEVSISSEMSFSDGDYSFSACFLFGSSIQTPYGTKAVEDLRALLEIHG